MMIAWFSVIFIFDFQWRYSSRNLDMADLIFAMVLQATWRVSSGLQTRVCM